MTLATHRRHELSSGLQTLIDSRLDTIERMLLGRVGRGERLAIVREVESQIDELLGGRETEELSREDVLAVLGQLDPPEAYLPDEFESEGRVELRMPARTPRPAALPGKVHPGVARASGILGLVALFALVLLMLSYAVAIAFQSELPVFVGLAISIPCMFVCGVLSITLGVYARKSGVWAIVGMVTGVVALLLLPVGGLTVLVL